PVISRLPKSRRSVFNVEACPLLPRRRLVAEVMEAQPEQKFQPYVSPLEAPYELTFRSLFFGGIFGILFGAVTVYVGLRAGFTVAASIPIAVLSISLLRAVGRVLP